jgi:hypothetical protein
MINTIDSLLYYNQNQKVTIYIESMYNWWGLPNIYLCDQVCQWPLKGQWFSLGTMVTCCVM